MTNVLRHACLGALSLAGVACSASSSSSTAGDAGDASSGSSADGAQDAPTADALGTSTDAATDGSPDAATLPDGGAGDGGLPDALGPVPDGGLLVQFVVADRTASFDPAQQETSTGTVTFGVANAAAADDAVADLTRTGGQAAIGTGGAEEIVSNRSFSFGTFRFRLSLATCASSEEVVNGPFAYFNDGSLAPDGLVVNREVDIEVLCGEPWLINLTIWTEYTDDTHLKNQSRVVDTKTGTVYVYANDQEGNELSTESHPELAIAGFPQAGAFYEMGWEWAADHLRYFLVNGGGELTLWNATDATRIPQLPMEQHFNIWAPGIHWSTGAKAAVPANDATLALDWFRYDPP
ncbi:MAG: hypothetical protein ACRELB_10405 [Polyangiaceae bacterium]